MFFRFPFPLPAADVAVARELGEFGVHVEHVDARTVERFQFAQAHDAAPEVTPVYRCLRCGAVRAEVETCGNCGAVRPETYRARWRRHLGHGETIEC